MVNMVKEQIGKAVVYIPDQASIPEPDPDTVLIQEIVQNYPPQEYHAGITGNKNYNAMYQLAETRGSLIGWLDLPSGTRVLEAGAGCGALTSVLLQKGAVVTCQEENVHYSRINATRHKDRELVIYAMPFEQCGPQLDQEYDLILLAGALTGIRAQEWLRQLGGHLTQQGSLLIALDNKFGLKYWAGNKENNTGQYFAGLENRTEKQGIRLYTRKGLEQLLAETGYSRTRFYYPYPDYRFARDIYSDRYLPGKGELDYNIANYEGDRLVLFNEQKVYDSVIEEGQFPLFSNSLLCVASKSAGCGALRQEIIYTRYASDRGRAYALRTDVLEDPQSGVRKVRKSPLYREGGAHVARIAQAYEKLREQYGGTDLEFNRCQLTGETCAEFEFIRGRALQTSVRELVAAGEIKKVFDILRRIVQYIRSSKNTGPFMVTEPFTGVFGRFCTEEFPEHTQSSGVSDIDLILPNILVDDQGRWHVIDYEWTFFFPVPQNFIIYRTLFFLNHENPGQEELSMDRLLKTVEITPEEAALYERMEAGFQQFVTGGLVPYREMVNLLERRFRNICQIEEEYHQAMAQNEMLKSRGFWKVARSIKRAIKPDRTKN